MRTLHVAAMPFPSPQGTQGLLHAMLSALHEAGDDVHLLCYAHGAGPLDASYSVHRPQGSRDTGSLRSGPSLHKLRLDVGLRGTLATLVRELAPDVVLAHHVEAAACALSCARTPVVYVAHTSLAAELPSYFPRLPEAPVRGMAAIFERVLCGQAARVLAVSPLLAEMLARDTGVCVEALRLPWALPAPITGVEREHARQALSLSTDAFVLLYAGNLDRYQGLDGLVTGLAMARASGLDFTWLVATESDRDELEPVLRDAGLAGAVRFVGLAGEQARRVAHAASDVALVPRHSPGGLPIKLLDALARGISVVATERAAAGLPLSQACTLIADDEPRAWAEALAQLASASSSARRALGERGREHVRSHHDPAAFVRSLHDVLAPLTDRARR